MKEIPRRMVLAVGFSVGLVLAIAYVAARFVNSRGRAPAAVSRPPLILRREMITLALTMPPGGTDYDTAEVIWIRSLEEEPSAQPPRESPIIPLDFAGTKHLAPLPTGIYRCTLKSRSGARIRDFALSASLVLRAKATPTVLSLPPSLSRTYIGWAGSTIDPRQPGDPTGFFCGVHLDLRKNTGEVSLAFLPLHREQSLRYGDLKPRPDTVWPISNLFLEDPVSLAFDCPLSHADYRMVLLAADGRVTLLPELILPEDERQQSELLGRMRTLIQVQARNAAKNPDWFDPRYVQLPAQQLPNNENLASRDQFARHLAKLSRTPVKSIDLGSQVTVHRSGRDLWEVQVESIEGGAVRP